MKINLAPLLPSFVAILYKIHHAVVLAENVIRFIAKLTET